MESNSKFSESIYSSEEKIIINRATIIKKLENINNISDIDDSAEGKLLIASMAKISVHLYIDKTPDEILMILKKEALQIYSEDEIDS